MAEYIERDQILGYMDLVIIHARGVAGNDSILKKVTDIVDNMRGLVAEAPAADVAPVVHGKWVGLEYDGYADGCPVYDVWECSECGEEVSGEDVPITHPYCHGCGARMDGEG
jgi:hypothetical protein